MQTLPFFIVKNKHRRPYVPPGAQKIGDSVKNLHFLATVSFI